VILDSLIGKTPTAHPIAGQAAGAGTEEAVGSFPQLACQKPGVGGQSIMNTGAKKNPGGESGADQWRQKL
jgi:hypothetical protein